MDNKHPFLLLAVVVVSGSYITGLLASAQFNSNRRVDPNVYANGYAAGANDIAKKITDSGMLPPILSTINTVSGTVKSVNGNGFVMTTLPLSRNPLDTQGPSERQVLISDQTKIIEKVLLTPAARDAAIIAFQKNTKAGKPTAPVDPYTDQQATIGDIKTGTTVTVTAADNIKDVATINAMQIEFVQMTVAAK